MKRMVSKVDTAACACQPRDHRTSTLTNLPSWSLASVLSKLQHQRLLMLVNAAHGGNKKNIASFQDSTTTLQCTGV
jgi:hypothetical protein